MLLTNLPIPFICITPATPEENHPDPFSPCPPAKLGVEDNGYRAHWLSLPPSAVSTPWHSSPLRPPSHRGLHRDQFNSLLHVSREQRAKFGSSKTPDLRKELALRSQNLKQLERRAHFLSKVNEPSGTALISVPRVFTESPTTTPCFVSPCRTESRFLGSRIAAENSEDLSPDWDEWVELIAEQPLMNSKFPPVMQNKPRHIPPSLDVITARLKSVRASSKKDSSPSRLPNFLTLGLTHDHSGPFAVRSLALNDEKFDTAFAQQVNRRQHADPCTFRAGLWPAVISYTDGAAGPTSHPSRADTARDMIVTLKRRSSPPPDLATLR